MDLKQHIRSIPDFPKPGVLFYDISTLLAHPHAWRATVDRLAEALKPHQPELLVGIESRGFLVAAPLAYQLSRGFAMVRKKGKLPGKTVRFTYDLEYGTDTIEIQEGAVADGQRVVVLDDLVAMKVVVMLRDDASKAFADADRKLARDEVALRKASMAE